MSPEDRTCDAVDSEPKHYQLILMMMIIMIIITIMTLKGAIYDFLQSPHCAANCLQHVRSGGQGAVVCDSRATHRARITFNMS